MRPDWAPEQPAHSRQLAGKYRLDKQRGRLL